MGAVQAALPPSNVPLVDKNGLINMDWLDAIHAILQRVGGTAVDKVEVAASTATTATAAAATAQAAAVAAQAAADAAQGSADAGMGFSNLNNSYVTGLTLTGHDAGSDADIIISNHTRVYGDGTTVSVTGDTLHHENYSDSYWVYYDDPSRSGGTVSYQVATAYADAFPSGANPDRHFVGAVTTPGALGPDTDGQGAKPPGYSGP
ncbi:MAG TPA: hypothetical protein VN579_07545 [Bryobacteraceae bacterium]|nr:hypothetical protein [Bryobacteraceae bacterium]